MKFNKLIFISLFLVIVSLSAVSAVDDLNSTGEVILTEQSMGVSDDLTVHDDEIPQENDGEIIKDGSSSIVITNETFSNYFDGEGRLLDFVAEGSILDFQGSIESSENIKAIYINKSVSIISSTKDATITLNTVNATLGIENITNRFIITNASSITIEDVTFNRTQIIIQDSGNVILDNISVISDNYKICQYSNFEGRKTPLLRLNNIGGFKLKNSYFYVFNIGATVINCNDTKNVLFDNNTFCGYADSRDSDKSFAYMILFSEVNTPFNFTNNNVHVNASNGGYFASVIASNILFENNTMEDIDASNEYSTYSIGTTLGKSGNSYNSIIRNNIMVKFKVLGNSTVYNNTVEFGVDAETSLMYNNVMDSLSLGEGCIAYNNTVIGSVGIKGNNVILKDSDVGRLGISVYRSLKNITIENNNIFGSKDFRAAVDLRYAEIFICNNTINGNIAIGNNCNAELVNNIIDGNIFMSSRSSSIIRNNIVVDLSSDYVIKISSDRLCINNEVYDNKLYSRLYCGDAAVSYDERYVNFIHDNTPETQLNISVTTTVNTFDYDENTTIIVNLPNVEGNVTIDVDGHKYVVELVKGSASQVISNYALGINNVTVIYEDTVNDIWAINHTTFTVNKVNKCPISLIYDNPLAEGKVSYVNVILPDDANGTIFISLTNGIYTLDIIQTANGRENKVDLFGLYEGNYTLFSTFSSVKYVTNSTTVNIGVVHIPVYKLTASNVVMDYKDGSKYKILVTKDSKAVGAGEVVKISFNGLTKNVKTDKNGYASLILDAAPKTYTIKAVYNGVSKSTKVTIKNILKASNIVKKKAKKIKFSATLKNSKGKAIIGKKISFKFKGKTYSAKTNKKGVVTITLMNLKVGKYTITSKYGECTVKNTIKIKK